MIVNTPPAAADDSIAANEDETLLLSALQGPLANDSDADGNSFLATLITDVSHGSLSLSEDGSLTYEPAADFFGEDRFTYTISDGVDTSSVATVTLVVAPVNDAPVGKDDTYFGAVGEPLEIDIEKGVLANDIDVDNASLTADLVTDPQNGNLTLNADGSFVYTPNVDFEGTDTFRYRANDGQLTSELREVSLFVGGTPPSNQ